MGADADAIRAALKQPESFDKTRASNRILDDDPVSAYLRIVSEDAKGGSNYGEIYRKWRGHPAAKNGWDQQPWGTEEDKRLLAELHDAEFWRVDASSERLAALANAADAMKTGITGLRGRLQNAWHGDAADAAIGQFDALAKALQTYHDTLSTLSTALGSSSTATWPSVEAIAWQGNNSAFADSGPDVLTIAEPSTQIDRINYRLYTEHSYTIEQMKQAGTVDLNEGGGMFSDTWWSDETIRGLDKMCDEYNASIRWFRQRLATAHKAVKDAWTTLNGQLTSLRDTGDVDPFGKLAMPSGKPDSGHDQQPPPGKHDTGVVEHTQPPPGQTTPSQVDPSQPPPGVTSPSQTDPGQTTPSQTDPSQPVPGQPSTGRPDPGGKESVTIKDGDRTITVDSPDGNGHVHLSVDGKDYDLDFEDAAGGTDQARDHGSFNGDLAGDSDQNDSETGSGKDGSNQNGSGDGAGKDGSDKVVIHDGSTTITAERDGGDGSIALTVDDGSGHPTEYAVDFDNPDQSNQPDPAQHSDTSASSTAASGDSGSSSASETSDGSASGASGSSGDSGASNGSASGDSGASNASGSIGASSASGDTSGASTGGTGADGNPSTSGQETHPQPGATTGASPQGGNQGAQPAPAPAAAAGPGQPGGGGGMGGGMPMMGGMGGGHGQGGDSERSASQWRTVGNLFADEDPAVRFDGVIGDDAPNRK